MRGGAFDRWDLEVLGGALGAVRVRTAIEEHGGGRQLLRVRAWPRVPRPVAVAGALVAVLLYILGRARPQAADIERFMTGKGPAWYSPPLLAALRTPLAAPAPAEEPTHA
jgi:hypothetical protein